MHLTCLKGTQKWHMSLSLSFIHLNIKVEFRNKVTNKENKNTFGKKERVRESEKKPIKFFRFYSIDIKFIQLTIVFGLLKSIEV